MQKAYNRINWENYPSDKTPLNDQNLNQIDAALDEVDNRILTINTTKLEKADAQTLVKSITFNRSSGIFTITYFNNTTATIDTMLEKLMVNFAYDRQNEQLVITLDDGTKQYVDLSALITQYEFVDSETIAFILSEDGKVSAKVKEGSIEEKHLRPNYLADIRVEAAKAQASEISAAGSAATAQQQAALAKGYADNSNTYSQQSKASADTSKEYLSKVEAAGADAVDAIKSALDIDAPEFMVDLSTGHLMYSGGRFTFNVDNNNGHLMWGLTV